MRHALTFFTCVGLVAVLSGCPDPDVEYADFEERFNKINPTTSGMGGMPGTGGGCVAPMAGEFDGSWVFLLSPQQSMTKPAPLKAEVTTADNGGTLQLTMDMQPLDANDRMTEVGTPFTLGPFDIGMDGTFEADFGEISVPGETNPLTDSPLVADVVIGGAFCDSMFLCGPILGNMVLMPLMLPLSGNWAMHKEESYMEPPVLTCSGDTAAPL